MAETEFREWLAEQAGALQSVSSGDDGILYFSQREQDGRLHCDIPVFGYYAADAYTLSRLFESLAAGLVQRKPVAFSVSLYAHDDRALRLFSLLPCQRRFRHTGAVIDIDIRKYFPRIASVAHFDLI